VAVSSAMPILQSHVHGSIAPASGSAQLFLKLPLPRPPKIIASPSRMTATGTSGALVM
jgi:hypothetical protein